MSEMRKNRQNAQVIFLLIAIALITLSCDAVDSMLCDVTGGEWVESDYLEGHQYDPALSKNNLSCDRHFNKEKYEAWKNGGPLTSEQAPNDAPLPEESLPESPDSGNFDPASCLPPSSAYTLEIQNSSNRTSPNGKRACNADGTITNNSGQTLMFATFRVNNYGAAETRYLEGKWVLGYRNVKPGETIEYGRFYRCTGGVCGAGEWYYIPRMSILYSAPGCVDYASSFENKPPESIVKIENPCDW